MVAVVIVLIGVVAMSMFWRPTFSVLSTLGAPNSTVNKSLDKVNPADVDDWMDWMAVFFYFAINILVCVILPLKVENNPVMIALLFIISFIYTFVVAMLSNALTGFLVSVGSTMNNIGFVIDNLVIFEVGWVLLMAIILYARKETPTMYY